MARITNRGKKIRATRRKNQVKQRLTTLNIGDKDKERLEALLTQDVHTKRGLQRSKRLETVIIDEGDTKKITRFKEFKGLKELGSENISFNDIVKSIGRHDYEWYSKNIELIQDYNNKFKEYKKEFGAGFMNRQSSNYNRTEKENLKREKETRELDKSLAEYRRKLLNKISDI